MAAVSGRMRRLPLSEPVLALTAGVLLGPEVSGLLAVPGLLEEQQTLHESARLLLAVSVMSVALRYPFATVRRRWRGVLLLLAVAMPAMAMVTTALGWALLGLPVAAAALLGTALAPTDPVLASSVVTGDAAEKTLPGRDRELLSLESGANDGLALPLVLVALAWAAPLTGAAAAGEIAWQVLGAVVLGVAAGWPAGRALERGREHGATEPGPAVFFTVVLALGVIGVSGLVSVDGVLAAFVAGLAFNAAGTRGERRAEMPIDEAVNRFAVLPLFVLLGAALPWSAWRDLGWSGVLLVAGVLSLRRLPVVWLLAGRLGLGRADGAYLGWFGPVGVSALFYLTLEAERMALDPTVLAAGSLVLAASTVAHGVTSAPGLALYERVTAPGQRQRDRGRGRRR